MIYDRRYDGKGNLISERTFEDARQMAEFYRNRKDPEKPEKAPPEPRCEFCWEYDGCRCHKEWNNNDDCYYDPDRDDKEPEDCCDDYEWNGEYEEGEDQENE